MTSDLGQGGELVPNDKYVIPAKAGIQFAASLPQLCNLGPGLRRGDPNYVVPADAGTSDFPASHWIPAFAGMTIRYPP